MNSRALKMFICIPLLALLSGCPCAEWGLCPEGRGDYVFTSAAQGAPVPGTGMGEEDGASEGEGEGENGEGESRGLVEPDVIRRDGALLYVLNQYRGLSLVDLEAEQLLSQVPTAGYPRDLYLAGARAYVLAAQLGSGGYAEDTAFYPGDNGSRLYVVDVENPEDAEVLGSLDLPGDLVDSRLVGNILYAVTAQYAWYGSPVAETDFDGSTGSGDGSATQVSQSWVTSVDVSNPGAPVAVEQLEFDGVGTVLQATIEAIFVAAPDWTRDSTGITYLDITDPTGKIAVRGSVEVPGTVADKFKLDAFEQVLRVVSATNWPEREVFVTTISLDNPDVLTQLGQTSIPGAEGETLFATRFDGPRAYVVTFLVIDPLFVIDLSDPALPRVAGELELPGWSTHIEPRGEELLALGVDDSDGNRRVKVSLFDVSNAAAPRETDMVSFGDIWSWSPAFTDVKAFTILDDLILVPVSGWTEAGGYADRLHFISYAPGSLELRGHVELQGQILRSFEFGGNVYGVTSEEVATINASDPDQPSVIGNVILAEYLEHHLELPDGAAVDVVRSLNQNTVTLRLQAGTGEQGELTLDAPNLTAVQPYGAHVLVVTTPWEGQSTTVSKIDCSGTGPVLEWQRVLPFRLGYFYGYGGGSGMEPGVADVAPGLWYPGYYTEKRVFLAGDTLALWGTADTFDRTMGDGSGSEGLALVDLITGQTETVRLALEPLVSIQTMNDRLYITTVTEAGRDRYGRSLVAHLLRTMESPWQLTSAPVNVPGAFLHHDEANDLLLCTDTQYGNFWEVHSVLNSLSWDGGLSATLVDSASLPGYGTVLAETGRVFFDGHGPEGAYLASIPVDPEGDLGNQVEIDLEGWGSLLAANGDAAYVSLNGQTIARYSFDGTPTQTHRVEVMSSPLRITPQQTAAFAPLGYAGLAELPL